MRAGGLGRERGGGRGAGEQAAACELSVRAAGRLVAVCGVDAGGTVDWGLWRHVKRGGSSSEGTDRCRAAVAGGAGVSWCWIGCATEELMERRQVQTWGCRFNGRSPQGPYDVHVRYMPEAVGTLLSR